MSEEWLSPAQLAERLDVSEKWVRRRIASGDIPAMRIGRRVWITPEGLEAMKERHAVVTKVTKVTKEETEEEWLAARPQGLLDLIAGACGA